MANDTDEDQHLPVGWQLEDEAATDQLIGENIAKIREVQGMSQADLALEMHRYGHKFHQQTVLKIEKGQRPLRFSEAVALQSILQIELRTLIWHPTHVDRAVLLEHHISELYKAREKLHEAVNEILDRRGYIENQLEDIERDHLDIGTGDALAAIALSDLHENVEQAIAVRKHDQEGISLLMGVESQGPSTFYGRREGEPDDAAEDGDG